jgi:hypothetical protein
VAAGTPGHEDGVIASDGDASNATNRAAGRGRRQIVFETIAAVAIGAGFVFVISRIAGPDADGSPLVALLAMPRMLPRPRGVQETDLAPFTFRDSGPATASASSGGKVRTIEPRMEPARAA